MKYKLRIVQLNNGLYEFELKKIEGILDHILPWITYSEHTTLEEAENEMFSYIRRRQKDKQEYIGSQTKKVIKKSSVEGA